MPHVLIIEDDPAISIGLQEAFTTEAFTVTVAQDGEDGCAQALKGGHDCIVLDVMLPGMNGYDVCRRIRAHGLGVPIIMLTSKGEEADIVMGLELGADDYLTKPFRLAELLARVRALLRRKHLLSAHDDQELVFGNVRIDFARLQAVVGGAPVKMSVREFEVMKYLAQHEGDVVTREMLLDDVWGYDVFPTTRTIDNYILMLRKKLEVDPAAPVFIRTVHAKGYRFSRVAD